MDSIRQREDEVRVEEISLEAQQRQLAEERRQFSVKCQNIRRTLEQTENETNAAQATEREARRELAESERQLAALAIEQRTLLARAAVGGEGYVPRNYFDSNNASSRGPSVEAVRASAFVDPMSFHVAEDTIYGTKGVPRSVHHNHLKTASTYYSSSYQNPHPLGDATNRQRPQQQEEAGEQHLDDMKAKFVSLAAARKQQQQHEQHVAMMMTNNPNDSPNYKGKESPPRHGSSVNNNNNNNTSKNVSFAARTTGISAGGSGVRYQNPQDRSYYGTTTTTTTSTSDTSGVSIPGNGGSKFDYFGVPATMRGHGISSMAAAYSPPTSMRQNTTTTTGTTTTSVTTREGSSSAHH
jgi:hypothetical protein